MSAGNDKLDDAGPEAEKKGPLAGERLADARREQQIPLIEIAKELHLDEYKIRALENNDFDVIGAPVFAKGHLRKYAQLVNVDQSDIMADYYQLNRTVTAPLVISGHKRPRQVPSLGPWIAAIIVILVVAAAYWWYEFRETPAEPPVTGQIAPLPEQPQPADEQQADIVSDVGEAATDAVTLGEEAEAIPEPVIDVIAAAQASDMRLSITYSGDCWTEITDASGRRLFFELGESGRTVNLAGEAPFNVLFGDAANVSLVVNGTAFEIPAASRRGRTARLTITGS